MAIFKQDYLSWMDDPDAGFYISNAWNFNTNKEIGVGRMMLTGRQRRILGYVTQQDENGRFPYVTVIISDIKKTGKTAISASIGAWFAECAPDYSEIMICANSQEQSERLIYSDLRFHFEHTKRGSVYKKRIDFENGTKIFVLSKNYTSAAGSRHCLTIWDELWGATSEDDWRRWDELQPIPTVTHSMRWVSSYAGFYGESKLLYDLYIKGVDTEESNEGQGTLIEELTPLPCYKNGRQFTYWGHEPHMPWQTDEYYEEAEKTERPNSYLRLHENRWVTSREVFIPIEWWEEAEKHLEQSAEMWTDHPYYSSPVYIGIDAATKRDCTAVVGVAVDTKLGKIIMMFHKIWTPGKDDPLDLEKTLEPYVLSKFRKFNVVDISCDPAHMYQIMTRLRNKNLPVHEFSQRDSSMIEASTHLYDLLRQDNIWAYPAPDIKDHLKNVMAEYTSRGLRIVKDKSNSRLSSKKIDAAVALAIACHRAYENVGMAVPVPIRIESNFADMSAWKAHQQEEPSYIPFALRTDD